MTTGTGDVSFLCGGPAEVPSTMLTPLIDHPLPSHLSLADRLSLPPIMVLQRPIPDADVSAHPSAMLMC